MNSPRLLFACVAGVFAAASAYGTAAEAQERKMVVLLDASGSMTLSRDEPPGTNRFQAATASSTERIDTLQQSVGLNSVAVYTFRGSEIYQHTEDAATGDAFVSADCAIQTLCNMSPFDPYPGSLCDGWSDLSECTDALSQPAVVSGLTPLAAATCDSVDLLMATDAEPKILHVASDGEENNSGAHMCGGPSSTISEPPYSAGSWHNNVYLYLEDNDVQYNVDLFEGGPALNSMQDVAAILDDPPTSGISTTDEDGPPELADFFRSVTELTGGEFRHIRDNEPLPVFGDLNGDLCVDAEDVRLLLENFGQTAPPADGKFDLTRDHFIGLSDYQLLVDQIDGTCGEGFPYEAMEPLTCRRDTLEIEGAAIATTGNAIEVQGACDITIRDSIIVAGESVIDSRGGVQVTIENSFVVGEDALVTARGAAWVSAANTLLRGIADVRGSWRFDDQGGNDWQ